MEEPVYLGGVRLSRRSLSILEEPPYPGGACLSWRSPSILEEPVSPPGGARLSWRSPSILGARLSVEKHFAPSLLIENINWEQIR